MTPVTPPAIPVGATRIVFAQDQPQYDPLPAAICHDGLLMTEWVLSAEDLARVVNGGRVRLWIWTFGRPLQPRQPGDDRMRVSELWPCDNCGGKIAPAFYVVRYSLALIRAEAANEFAGMHRFLMGKASPALVENFAPAAHDAALVLMDADKSLRTELFICQSCFLDKPIDLALLMERRARRAKGEPG